MTRRFAPLVLGALLGGCGAATAGTPTPPASTAGTVSNETIADWNREALPRLAAERPGSVVLRRHARPPQSTVALGRDRRVRRSARAGSPIDVRFRRAELSNALRFLAEAGRVQLVVGEGVSGEVDVTLRRVTALEALEIIAMTHGAEVRRRGPVVIVTAAR